MDLDKTPVEVDAILDSLLLECSPVRARTIKEGSGFIREDIPLEDWNFKYGLFYDDRIAIWHKPTMKYKPLFQFV